MTTRFSRALVAVLGAVTMLIAAEPVSAQADILLQLRSGNPAGDRFRVDSAGGVVAMGNLGLGIIPASGAGVRMMWHPYKGAFRAGAVNTGGNEWDDFNIGFYSWAGGVDSEATQYATFAYGDGARAVDTYATAIGYRANADGTAALALGYRTTADSDYGVALGHRASTNGFTGAIVLSDASSTDSVEASANNQFSLRAAGGIRLYTNAVKTTGVQINAGGSSWNVISDVNRKQNFNDIDAEDLLARVRSVPVSRWQYIDEANRSTWHIGPMAQDWHAAFRLGDDPLTINMSDLDGVNLAAAQALERRTAEQAERLRAYEARIEEQDARIARQDTRIGEQDARIRQMEETLARLAEELRRLR